MFVMNYYEIVKLSIKMLFFVCRLDINLPRYVYL